MREALLSNGAKVSILGWLCISGGREIFMLSEPDSSSGIFTGLSFVGYNEIGEMSLKELEFGGGKIEFMIKGEAFDSEPLAPPFGAHWLECNEMAAA